MNDEIAIVLVAGRGSRLAPLTDTLPKCLVEVGGAPLLLRALEAFAATGVRRGCLVVGHLEEVIRDRLGDRHAGVELSYVVNERWATTNSMYSLLLGLRAAPGAPVWVLEGDVAFERKLLLLPTTDESITWLADSSLQNVSGAFLRRDGHGRALALAIRPEGSPPEPDTFKSCGLLHLSAEGASRVRAWLEEDAAAGLTNQYYDLTLRARFARERVAIADVAGTKWFEIDSSEDLDVARKLFGTHAGTST